MDVWSNSALVQIIGEDSFFPFSCELLKMCFQSWTLLTPWQTLLKLSKRWTAAVTVSLVFQWKIVVSVACMSRLPDELDQIYQCTVQFILHHLRIYTWILDSWLVLPEFLLKCWCSWHGSCARTSFLSVHTEVHVSRKRTCFKKCIFRETAWAALRTSIAGIRISTDLKSFYGLRQNRGKHS